MAAIVHPPATRLGRALVVGLIVGLAAGVANVLVYFLTQALFSLPYLVPMGGPGTAPSPLPVLAIIAACLVPALAAALFYWALGRFTRRATMIFVVAAAAFALLSLAGPLSLPIDLGTRLALASMHIVAAVVVVIGLTRNAPQP